MIDASFDVIEIFLSLFRVLCAFASMLDLRASSKLPLQVNSKMHHRDKNPQAWKKRVGVILVVKNIRPRSVTFFIILNKTFAKRRIAASSVR